jgi:hypothetical protein
MGQMVMCTLYMSKYYLCGFFVEILGNEKIRGKWWDRWWCIDPVCQEIWYKDL